MEVNRTASDPDAGRHRPILMPGGVFGIRLRRTADRREKLNKAGGSGPVCGIGSWLRSEKG